VSRGRPYKPRGVKVGLQDALPAAIAGPRNPRFPHKGGKKAPEAGDSIVEDNEPASYENISPQAGELAKEKYEKKLQAAVRKRLTLFPDPFHIAQQVSALLEKDRFDEALLMARIASAKAKVEVSWNNLIDYQLRNKRLHAAIKLYNEVRVCPPVLPRPPADRLARR
jgi:pentatricopeptide repeat protein